MRTLARIRLALWLFAAVAATGAWGKPHAKHHHGAHPAAESPASPGSFSRFLSQATTASKQGMHTVRVLLIGDDEQYAQMHELIEEVEHALEPPSQAEGFWRSKWEIVKSLGDVTRGRLPPVFDFRRSFQNLARVFRSAKYKPNPTQRELLASSGTMFGITHGSEVVFGLVTGTAALLHGNIPVALGLYSMIIPGLDDFGCLIGQGLLVVRPTRYLFNTSRKAVVWIAGKALNQLGAPFLMKALFDYEPARERILAAAKKHGTQVVDLQIPDDALMRLTLKNAKGEPVLHLQFAENESHEIELKTATFDEKKFARTPYSDFSRVLRELGWNTNGALRQIHNLLNRGEPELIAEEKTFVSGVGRKKGKRVITFREHAVVVTAKRHLRWGRGQAPAGNGSPGCVPLYARLGAGARGA
jgi:hypothetical protein